MQIEGRFFQRVCTVGQHHAADFGVVQRLGALLAQHGPVFWGDVFAGQVAALHTGDAGHTLDAGQGFEHAVNGEHPRLIADLFKRRGGNARNGAARGNKGHLGQGGCAGTGRC